ncbi:hypothetical protein BAE44_0010046 [Dichanthelium oligosanthes]|uniref:Uncharacterized protein n=1 Tax=Dichanthelium oligosanthes TaxID=888268 RepID=A0A1E5VV10_9POAL|nr:hypothetical protein BAE44_0010046 [Dichanthelium oligosanthes]
MRPDQVFNLIQEDIHLRRQACGNPVLGQCYSCIFCYR